LKENSANKGQKRILLASFFTLLNDRMSESILLGLLPGFVRQYIDSARVFAYISCTYSLAQFIASPSIGLFSDKFGRRPVILTCILGSILGISILAFTVLFDWSNTNLILGTSTLLPIYLLFTARLIDGISGGTVATATTVLADISSPENRAKTFGLIGVAFGLSFLLGPSAVLIFTRNSSNGYLIPVLIATLIPFINFLLVFFYLPETKPKSEGTILNKKPGSNPFEGLFKVFKENRIKKLSLAFFIYFIAFTGLTTILVFFLQDAQGWSVKASNGPLVVVGIIAIVVQGGLIGPLVKKFGELKLTISGTGFILFACLLLITFPEENSGKYIYIAVSFLAIGAGLITPSIRALISKKIDKNSQGSILSSLQGLQSLGSVLGYILAGNIYDYFGPRSPFIAGGLILSLMIWLITGSNIQKKVTVV
tara:strand:- start:6471 stop:7745 length:1275 start_codon:yes stop_codon:yes gene_type:complete